MCVAGRTRNDTIGHPDISRIGIYGTTGFGCRMEGTRKGMRRRSGMEHPATGHRPPGIGSRASAAARPRGFAASGCLGIGVSRRSGSGGKRVEWAGPGPFLARSEHRVGRCESPATHGPFALRVVRRMICLPESAQCRVARRSPGPRPPVPTTRRGSRGELARCSVTPAAAQDGVVRPMRQPGSDVGTRACGATG